MEFKKQTLAPQHPEIFTSYPPAYLIGPLVGNDSRVVLVEDSEMATVTLEEWSAEYMYSNP